MQVSEFIKLSIREAYIFDYFHSYGGCIPKQAECNGTKECFDGSDENTSKCPAKSTSTIRVCGFSGCIVKQV